MSWETTADSSLPFLKVSFLPALPDLQETDPWSFLQPGGFSSLLQRLLGLRRMARQSEVKQELLDSHGQLWRASPPPLFKARCKVLGSPTVRMGMPLKGRQPGVLYSLRRCLLSAETVSRQALYLFLSFYPRIDPFGVIDSKPGLGLCWGKHNPPECGNEESLPSCSLTGSYLPGGKRLDSPLKVDCP